MAGFEIGTFTLGSLLGLVLGAFLGHALAIRRSKALAKHNAAIEFKKMLIPTIDKLESGENQFGIIQDSFDHHYKSAIVYSAYLTGKDLEAFKIALQKYKHWQNTMYGRSTSEVFYDSNDPEYLNAKKTTPVSLINELLNHANT
jgi:hypothetical protein